jgi:hypothetical protein
MKSQSTKDGIAAKSNQKKRRKNYTCRKKFEPHWFATFFPIFLPTAKILLQNNA